MKNNGYTIHHPGVEKIQTMQLALHNDPNGLIQSQPIQFSKCVPKTSELSNGQVAQQSWVDRAGKKVQYTGNFSVDKA